MKLHFRRVDYIDCSDFLVEAAFNNDSAIRFALGIEEEVFSLSKKVAELRCLPELFGYAKRDYKRLIETIEDLFYFEGEDCDYNHLTDQDYINIANFVFPNEYDRVFIIKSGFATKFFMQEGTGRDFSYWTEFYEYSYKVIARKNVYLDETKEYSLEELVSLIKSKDILIIAGYANETDGRNCKNKVVSDEQLSKLQSKEWLEFLQEDGHPFQKYYIAYLKQFITGKLIDECLNSCYCACNKLLEYPGDKSIMESISDNGWEKVFEGMDANQLLMSVKQYAKSNDIINKARAIIVQYSDVYQKYFA